MNSDRRSEGVNESGVAEQRAQRVPIKAQSTAVPVGTARADNTERNAEWDDLGAMSGHGGFVHTLSSRVIAQGLGEIGAAGSRVIEQTAFSGQQVGLHQSLGLGNVTRLQGLEDVDVFV